MFPKLLAIVLITTGTALALLSLRQSRINTVNRMARVNQDTLSQERMIWTIRQKLAESLQADRLHEIIGNQLDWSSIEQPSPPLITEHVDTDRG